jgi:AcrR family transcriptional regulator
VTQVGSHKEPDHYDPVMGMPAGQGRVNQKRRTREAIVRAARELIADGAEFSMPAVARSALVSEATAYRYFPDLPSLLQEALVGMWPDPAEALAPVKSSTDPVERIACATQALMRGVLGYELAARAGIAASLVRPETALRRPGFRFALIDHALEPLSQTSASLDAETLSQLKRDLAMVISAEALFTLTDVCGLSTDEAIATAVHAACVLTRAATSADAELVEREKQGRLLPTRSGSFCVRG